MRITDSCCRKIVDRDQLPHTPVYSLNFKECLIETSSVYRLFHVKHTNICVWIRKVSPDRKPPICFDNLLLHISAIRVTLICCLLFVRISVDYFPFSVGVPDMAFCTGFVAIDTLADFSDGTLALRAGFWLDFTVIRVLVSDFCSAEFLGFLSFGKGLVDVVTTGVCRCGVFVSGYLASLLTHLCIGYSL